MQHCHNLYTKMYPYESLHKGVICNYSFILYRVWMIYKAWWIFFNYSIASFDMLLSGCNRAIMNLQYWSEREFRPFPWGKQSFFYLSVYLNFPYLWYLHPMMCCGGDFFQNLTDFFWCDNEERSSHLLINSSHT